MKKDTNKKDVGMDVDFCSAEASFLLVSFFIIYAILTPPFILKK